MEFDVKKLLFDLSVLNGPSGGEYVAVEFITNEFKRYTDDVTVDALGNIIAVLKSKNPNAKKILLDAHYDEIAMMVTEVDKDGFIRFANRPGLDPKILLASEVTIMGRNGEVYGIVSCLPPHLPDTNSGRVPPIYDTVIDIGYGEEKAKELVERGNFIVPRSKPAELMNNAISGKAMDDRASLAAIIYALDMIKDKDLDVTVIAMASVQEETGCRGAKTGAFAVTPDEAIVIDVCHAKTHDASGDGTHNMGGGPCLDITPLVNRAMTDKLTEIAKEKNIPVQHEYSNSMGGTNATSVQIACGGVKIASMGLPLKYMHTPIEELSIDDVKNTGKLAAEYILKEGGYIGCESKKEPEQDESSGLPEAKALLKRLCGTSGISSMEDSVRELITNEISKYIADTKTDIKTDNLGNLIVFKKGRRIPEKRLMFAAHMDEVGMFITKAEDNGCLRFQFIGGIDTRVLNGRRVLVGKNRIPGVVGIKAVHIQDGNERNSAPNVKSLAIDIGAKNKDEALSKIKPGDFAVFDSDFAEFGEGFIKAKAIDDRLGCALLIELIKSDLEYDTYFAFTVQEEVGLRGATVAAYTVKPDVAVVVESTTAADFHPSKDGDKACMLGNGPVISLMDNSTIYNRRLIDCVTKLADTHNIQWQYKTVIAGGNDSGAIQRSTDGVYTVTVSVPCRYIHSPSCVINWNDALKTKDLLFLLAAQIMTFTP